MSLKTGKAIVRLSDPISLEIELEKRTRWRNFNYKPDYHIDILNWLWALRYESFEDEQFLRCMEPQVMEMRVFCTNDTWSALTITISCNDDHGISGNVIVTFSNSNKQLRNLYKTFPFSYGLQKNEVAAIKKLIIDIVEKSETEPCKDLETCIMNLF